MSSASPSTESYFRVGQSIIFYPEAHRPEAARHEVVLRGWQRGAYVLLEMNPPPARNTVFRENADCSLRFLKDGIACSLDATILDWQVSRKKPTFTVSWPKSIRTAAVRRNERVEMQYPCTIYCDSAEYAGTMQDLSVGGCGIQSPRLFDREKQLVISMTLPDGVYIDHAPVLVKSSREVREGLYYLGCMFEGATPEARASIEFYVTSTLLRARGGKSDLRMLLFMDPELEIGAPLPDALRRDGFEVHLRTNMIDGLSFARLRIPTALIVRYDWGSATALDLCRLLSTSPVLQNAPVLVIHAPENTHESLRAAGVTACYKGLPDAMTLTQQLPQPTPATAETPA